MKLFLTSIGLSNKKITDYFLKCLPKKTDNCSILIVDYVENNEQKLYLEESKEQLFNLGVKKITDFNLTDKKFLDVKKAFDIIYVCGGNTYEILDRMRKTGIADYIKKQSRKKKIIYFGISAGSIIAGPNIEIAGWGSEADTNDIHLKDLEGLNLTKISTYPHFRKDLKKEVNDFRKVVSYPVIELSDGQAIFIEGDKYHTI